MNAVRGPIVSAVWLTLLSLGAGCGSEGYQSDGESHFSQSIQKALRLSEEGRDEECLWTLGSILNVGGEGLSQYFGDAPDKKIWRCVMGRIHARSGKDREYVLALLSPKGVPVPGTEQLLILLLTPEGRLTDWVCCSANSRETDLIFGEPSHPGRFDDVSIVASTEGLGGFTGFVVDHRGRRTKHAAPSWWPKNPDPNTRYRILEAEVVEGALHLRLN
jgi:hypothetical protein